MVVSDHDPALEPVHPVLRVLQQQRDKRLDLQDLGGGQDWGYHTWMLGGLLMVNDKNILSKIQVDQLNMAVFFLVACIK